MHTTLLAIGQPVWIEYHKGTYQGMRDDRYVVRVETKDEVSDKLVPIHPIVDDGWRPQGLYKKNGDYLRFSGKIHCWKISGQLCLYYEMKTTDCFKDTVCLTRSTIDQLEVVPESVLWDEDAINEALNAINERTSSLQEQVDNLNNKIREINKEKVLVYERCFHEWEKGEEEKTSKNFLGQGYQRTCTCIICGMEKTQHFTRL